MKHESTILFLGIGFVGDVDHGPCVSQKGTRLIELHCNANISASRELMGSNGWIFGTRIFS